MSLHLELKMINTHMYGFHVSSLAAAAVPRVPEMSGFFLFI